jgi:threonine synthase
MDIQVSSNFERLLFEVEERNAAAVRGLMAGLAQSGSFTLGDAARQRLGAVFSSGACDETETANTIAAVRQSAGVVIDPHSAVGVAVAERHLGTTPMVALATAHPAKFPDPVEAACGTRPELPDWAKTILSREERYRVLPADLAAIEQAVEAKARAAEVVH